MFIKKIRRFFKSFSKESDIYFPLYLPFDISEADEKLWNLHNTFEIAADSLVIEYVYEKEDIEIVEPLDWEEKERYRLKKKLGFKLEKKPCKVKKTRDTFKISKLINYHYNRYPLYKFLPLTKFDELCLNYGLKIFDLDGDFKYHFSNEDLHRLTMVKPLKRCDTYNGKIFHLVGIGDLHLIKVLGRDAPIFTQEEVRALTKKYFGNDVPEWTDDCKSTTWLYVVCKKILGEDNSYKSGKYYSYNSVITHAIEGGKFHIIAHKDYFTKDSVIDCDNYPYPIVIRYVCDGIQIIGTIDINNEKLSMK